MARENYEKYGHPDGPQAMRLLPVVALPEWLLAGDGSVRALSPVLLQGYRLQRTRAKCPHCVHLQHAAAAAAVTSRADALQPTQGWHRGCPACCSNQLAAQAGLGLQAAAWAAAACYVAHCVLRSTLPEQSPCAPGAGIPGVSGDTRRTGQPVMLVSQGAG